MPQYGNAATILPFPDLYTSNRIAEPKVLSGGISTGNWGRGAGLPGTKTTAAGVADNTAFLKQYGLDTAPEDLQQKADMTREVLQAYADLKNVYAGFRKKGIDLGAIDPANPVQVEAASIYKNLASDYLFKLNQVKQGAKYEKLIAEKQAANPNVIPVPFDNTQVITPETVAASTQTGTPAFIEKWNTEGRTSAKSEAEYNQRLVDQKRIIDNIDVFGQMGGQPPEVIEFWKSQVLAPTPFTPEAVNPLEDEKLRAQIDNLRAAAQLTRARIKKINEGGQGTSVNAFYRSAAGFVFDAKAKMDNDPNFIRSVPELDIRDGEIIPVQNMDASKPEYSLTNFGVPMNYATTSGGEVTNMILRRNKAGQPVYYVVEKTASPVVVGEGLDAKVVSMPAFKFRKVENPSNVIKTGELAGLPIDIQRLAGGIRSVSQVDAFDQYGGDETDNWLDSGGVQPSTNNGAQPGTGVRRPRPVNPLD